MFANDNLFQEHATTCHCQGNKCYSNKKSDILNIAMLDATAAVEVSQI